MEAYSRIRQDSLVHYTRERRRSGFFRQSWEFLSRFLDKRQDHDLSHQYQRGLAIDYSSTGSSETSLLPPTGESEFGDVQSVTTFASSATLDEKALENKLIEDASIRSLVPVHRGKFADSAALGDKKLKPVRPALPPSLGMTGTEITQIDIRLQNGQSITWRKRMGILEVPETVRKNIWRNAVVNDKKLFICNCYYCKAHGVTATQPPLTRTSRSIRAEAIPIYYQENRFRHPLSHPDQSSVRGWLNSIGLENRCLLNHLELAFLNTERAIESLDIHYRIRPASKEVVVENVVWDDGEMGEVEWNVFTARKAVREVGIIEEEGELVGTTILFEQGKRETIRELEFEQEESCEDMCETTSGSGDSSEQLSLPTPPPQVRLTRKNGEDIGDPRWSFAPKFNEHVLSRLDSLSRDPGHKEVRKPVTVTTMPGMVIATDRDSEDDLEGFDEDILQAIVEEPILLTSKRYTGGGKWAQTY